MMDGRSERSAKRSMRRVFEQVGIISYHG